MQEDEMLVGPSAMARILDISLSRFNQLVENGMFNPVITDGRYKKYVLGETSREYIRSLRKRKDANGIEDLQKEKLETDIEFKRTKTDQETLRLQELEGSLLRASDVEAVFIDSGTKMRSMIAAIPGRATKDAFEATTAMEVTEAIRRETDWVLDNMAHYRFDPDEFSRRMRERETWMRGPHGSDDSDGPGQGDS